MTKSVKAEVTDKRVMKDDVKRKQKVEQELEVALRQLTAMYEKDAGVKKKMDFKKGHSVD